MVKSHGQWSAAIGPLPGILYFKNSDGVCWYDYQKGLPSEGVRFALVVNGVVNMVETDASRIVPHLDGEVFELPADMPMKRGWIWHGDHAAEQSTEPPEIPPPSEEEPTATEKLAAFLAANPDVKALIA